MAIRGNRYVGGPIPGFPTAPQFTTPTLPITGTPTVLTPPIEVPSITGAFGGGNTNPLIPTPPPPPPQPPQPLEPLFARLEMLKAQEKQLKRQLREITREIRSLTNELFPGIGGGQGGGIGGLFPTPTPQQPRSPVMPIPRPPFPGG